ncbi:hypothetical protein JOD97_006145 [Duganella sp. 1411]|nr:hypothetical protein [Duganella sp. 1411]
MMGNGGARENLNQRCMKRHGAGPVPAQPASERVIMLVNLAAYCGSVA